MPQPTKGPRLGGSPAHERLMLANLATSLFAHKSIKTTHTKAKRLRPLAEHLITAAKRGDLHARRRVAAVIRDKSVVHELFTEIAPLMAERHGGYTRIVKLGFRKGDNAPMSQIELVLEPVTAPKHRKSAEQVAAEKKTGQAATESATPEAPTEAAAGEEDSSAEAVSESVAGKQAPEPEAEEASAAGAGSADADSADADSADADSADADNADD